MTLKDFYKEKTSNIKYHISQFIRSKNITQIPTDKLEQATERVIAKKKKILIPFLLDTELNCFGLKSYYFTKTQTTLIDIIAAKDSKKQSEFVREIITDGLISYILHHDFTKQEVEEYSKILMDEVEEDFENRQAFYEQKRNRKDGKRRGNGED